MTVRVNKLMSSKTQLPYDYYSMPFCKPESVRRYSENLGQKLRGDRIETSLYKVPFLSTSIRFESALVRDDAKRYMPPFMQIRAFN